MANVRWGAMTSSGMVRSENEDTYVTEPMVFAVADGMGGHQAGEVASALAASIVRDRLGRGAASEDDAESVVHEVNAAIYGAARANAAQSGMGTTLTALAVLKAQGQGSSLIDEQLVLLNVGDSRTYLFRNGKLSRVTVDHSYVQELVATGHITAEEARTHPRRNIVTRALGIEVDDPVDPVDAVLDGPVVDGPAVGGAMRVPVSPARPGVAVPAVGAGRSGSPGSPVVSSCQIDASVTVAAHAGSTVNSSVGSGGSAPSSTSTTTTVTLSRPPWLLANATSCSDSACGSSTDATSSMISLSGTSSTKPSLHST